MKCPCRGCTDRTITCHGVCERYQEWKKENDAEKKWLREQKPQLNENVYKQQAKNIKNRARGYLKNSKSVNGGDGRW